MTHPLSLLQFQSPWQGRNGFTRFTLDKQTGHIAQTGSVKARKLLRKGAGNLDGLILKPAWPTMRRLCVLLDGETLHLYPMRGQKVDLSAPPIDVLDPDFRAEIRERLFYRTFIFANARQRVVFSDLEGRLFGPQRTALDIFPMEDFSPFARLIRMLADPVSRMSLILDMQDHRLDYPKWIESGMIRPRPSVRPA